MADGDERLSDGDTGEGVPCGATTRDDGERRRRRLVGHDARRATFMSKPQATMVTTRDDPPADTRGSGTPVMGRTPTATPRFTTAWSVTQVVMPAASSMPNRSGARRAIIPPSTAIATNRPMVSRLPSRPNSSLMFEKMKSVWPSGRNPNFERP